VPTGESTIAGATSWNKARIEALSDGVFAIVMTLLVLELKVPEFHTRSVPTRELWAAVLALWPVFFSFLVTFILASLFWFWHHVSFHYIRRADGPVLAINLLFLMFVSLLPFSTAMLGAFTLRQPVSLGFYFGNQLALGLVLNAHWIYARRHGLVSEPDNPVVRRLSLMLPGHPIACVATLAMIAIDPQYCFTTFMFVQVPWNVIARRRSERARP
jgi:uncharacterized membrane protein